MFPGMFDLFSLEMQTGPAAFSVSLNQFLEIPGTFPDIVPLQTYRGGVRGTWNSSGALDGGTSCCMHVFEKANVACLYH